MGQIRTRLRRTADVALGRLIWPLLRLPGPRLIILTYHRVLPERFLRYPFLQPGMVTTPETLRLHIEELRDYVAFVHLDEWIRRATQGMPLPKTACALTFDDGWKDFHEYAFPVLAAEAVPASVFVVTDMLGSGRLPWPERLARLLWANGEALGQDILQTDDWTWVLTILGSNAGARPFSQAEIDRVVTTAKKWLDAELEQRLSDMERSVQPAGLQQDRDFLTWDELQAALRSGIVRAGSHTRRHRRLTPGLNRDELEDEIAKSRIILQDRTGQNVTLFCYPNGDMTPEATAVVRRDYEGACSTINGWNVGGCDMHALKRVSLHQGSAHDKASFGARLIV